MCWELHQRYHLAPLAAVTGSNIQVREWIRHLLEVQQEVGLTHGPAFGDRSGQRLTSRFIESTLVERLQLIKDTQQGIIPHEIDCYEDFGVSRSFRRGATSTARAQGVNPKLILDQSMEEV
jgi:hypothetical protein